MADERAGDGAAAATGERVRVERDGAVAVVHMVDGENRFSPAWLDAFEGALDEVEAMDDPVGLVLTGEGKFFSNGLDLEHLQSGEADLAGYVARVQQDVFRRVLTLPLPTAAAINGHAFAAGAMLSLCCDSRVMRADRGFWCLPEVDINIPFTHGMNALISQALVPQARTRAMVWGERLGGAQAATLGVVDAAVPADDVVRDAVALVAARAGKSRDTVGAIKRRLHAATVEQLERSDFA